MEVKILHLFPRLLSLYGEWGNVAVLKMTLESLGHTVTVTECEDGKAEFGAYDLCYVGAGVEDNLPIALKRLLPQVTAIRESVSAGKLWLATGNAMALFGRTLDGTAAVGLFGYETSISNKRFLGDVLSDDGTLGFINTSCVYKGVEKPLLTLKLGAAMGNDKASAAEGVDGGNFLGTQLIGPFLVKNPRYLEKTVRAITGEPWQADSASNLSLAYETALKELQNRLKG